MPNRFASVVNIPTVVDTRRNPCSSSLSRSAPSRNGGTGAKSIVTVPHAVAWRVASGTGAVGFLKSAVYGLRAIENPARAVALLTEMIALQASHPPLRNPLKPDAGCHVLEKNLRSGSLGCGYVGHGYPSRAVLWSWPLGCGFGRPPRGPIPFLTPHYSNFYEVYKHLLGNDVEITVQIHRGVS